MLLSSSGGRVRCPASLSVLLPHADPYREPTAPPPLQEEELENERLAAQQLRWAEIQRLNREEQAAREESKHSASFGGAAAPGANASLPAAASSLTGEHAEHEEPVV